MITFLQLIFCTLVLAIISYAIVYFKQKRYKEFKELAWQSVTDAVTMNSGIIILLYASGKILKIDWLMLPDDYTLGIALLIAGLLILASGIDKYKWEKPK